MEVSGQLHAPAASIPGKEAPPYPLGRKLGIYIRDLNILLYEWW